MLRRGEKKYIEMYNPAQDAPLQFKVKAPHNSKLKIWISTYRPATKRFESFPTQKANDWKLEFTKSETFKS
jgi:hypothetical protein